MNKAIDPYDKYVAGMIRDARIKNRYSQEAIGKMLNLPKQSISRMEMGRRKISPKELAKIAKFLDLSIDKLLDETKFEYEIPAKSYGENLSDYAEIFLRGFESDSDYSSSTSLKELKHIAKEVNRVMSAIIKEVSERERIYRNNK